MLTPHLPTKRAAFPRNAALADNFFFFYERLLAATANIHARKTTDKQEESSSGFREKRSLRSLVSLLLDKGGIGSRKGSGCQSVVAVKVTAEAAREVDRNVEVPSDTERTKRRVARGTD